MRRADWIERDRLARKARRICLCCDKYFASRGKENRICRKCSQRPEFGHNVLPRGRVLAGGGEGDST